jgi:phosphoribosyl 1,2-cyclic phosphodiesterase
VNASNLKATIWGSCGSLPSPTSSADIRRKIKHALLAAPDEGFKDEATLENFISKLPHSIKGTYRANTSCVQIIAGTNDCILCDAGTGLRDFSLGLPKEIGPKTYHIFLSHLHWDHIQGFPFFGPAYQAGNKIIFHGFHPETESTIRRQMEAPCFPVSYSSMLADIQYDIADEGMAFRIDDVLVTTIKQQHPGDSWGFRFEKAGRSIVYSTDAEHASDFDEVSYPFIKFFKDADILILDGQYSFEEAMNSKRNWGHSNHQTAVKLAALSKVKQLVLYHHEPSYSDSEIADILEAAQADKKQLSERLSTEDVFPIEILSAFDGLKLTT